MFPMISYKKDLRFFWKILFSDIPEDKGEKNKGMGNSSNDLLKKSEKKNKILLNAKIKS